MDGAASLDSYYLRQSTLIIILQVEQISACPFGSKLTTKMNSFPDMAKLPEDGVHSSLYHGEELAVSYFFHMTYFFVVRKEMTPS